MKKLQHLLAFSLAALIVLINTVQPATALGGWVDHKFEMERPDGTKMDLKGAKMHIYHHSEEGGFTHVNSFCAYPDKDSNIAKYVDEDNNADDITLSGGYHCLTPQSCSNTDFGAPYLPRSFNSNDSVYTTGNTGDLSAIADASYRAFHDTNFTGALTGNVAYLAGMYKQNNIRGFEGAKWEMQLDWVKGTGVAKASQSDISSIPSQPGGGNWGTIPGIEGKQTWSEGEVYKDTNGENQLHARITWVLKPPAPAPIVKPTASLAGKCTNSTPGLPSFTYTFSNIDLKGQEFSYARIYLKFKHDAQESKIIAALGEPFYTNGESYGYSFKLFTTPPTTFEINKDTPIYGKDGAVKATLGQFITNTRSQLPTDYTFDVAGNLESKSGGTTTLNDYIKVSFQPKFINDECGKSTGGGTIPACVSLTLLDGDNRQITNMGAVLPGASMKILCGPVTGVNKYAFRLVSFNEQGGQVGEPLNVAADSTTKNRSQSFNIPNNGGRFTAQCAICENDTNNCQFEIPNYNQPANVPNTQCISPNTCTTSAGCTTVAASGSCAVNGLVCCANRKRDVEVAPNVPTPTPAGVCASPNSCTTSAGCNTPAASGTCATAGEICCANRKRDETPVPAPSSTPAPTPFKNTSCNGANSCVPNGTCPGSRMVTGKLCGNVGSTQTTCCRDLTRDE